MSVQPLLMRFSGSRTDALEIPGRYDDARQVWVIDGATGSGPIIEADDQVGTLAELVTKTNTIAERDDPGVSTLVELTTKTEHQLERDDVDPRLAIQELITVTKVGREQPDV